jgi:Dolichyl-phosphate-mannose-protein mannosyltransferase
MIPSDKVNGPQTTVQRVRDSSNWLPLSVLAAGFGARLYEAASTFLNPDEALHNLLASQSSLSLAYKAALTNAHPPLLILVLYYWHVLGQSLGQSELMLRLPSVLAGTACCWLMYLWLKEVSDRSTAFVGLLLLAFSPALIGLSAEVRQYALLLFFMSACLYLSERAIQQDSPLLMILFSLSLYGAILVHYSSLLFAFAIGVYMLARLRPYGRRLGLVAVWGVGQIGGLALGLYFVFTHALRLRREGMLAWDYDSWLRKSIFHSGERNVFSFAAVQTLRVFTYAFSHGVVGTLGLLAFLAGMVWLLRGKISSRAAVDQDDPSARELALLLGLAFAANCGVALAGQYPYGGTRHSAFLLLFAISGVCIGLGPWARSHIWPTSLLILCAMAVCNFFPSPPPAIRARDQARGLMKDAVDSFRQSAAPGSIVVADYQSGLLFGYYVCGHGVVQVFPPLRAFEKEDCGPYQVITTSPQAWRFSAGDFPAQLASVAKTYRLEPRSKVWLFDAGWIADSAPALRRQLEQFGCSAPTSFGKNILLCQLELGGKVEQLAEIGHPPS